MRILFADKFPDRQLAEIQARGHDCELRSDLAAADLPAAIPGFEVLVVRSTRVEGATFAEADALELVIRAGAGYNTIDVVAAADRGVYVSNVPGKNAIAVAELAFGLMLAVDRNIPDNVADLRAGRWDKARYQKARGMYGRVAGVIGLGAIGLAFAERAHAFGMQVHALAKTRDEDAARRLAALGVTYPPDLAKLAAASDVLSFHVPADATTRGMIGADLLEHVRPGTIVLNTSRGDLVDEGAMLAALDRGVRAGFDVYPDEPSTGTGEYSSALARHRNVYGTHHIGASTDQAQHAIADEVVGIIADFEAGAVRNPVNLEGLRGTSTLLIRHLNEVGVLARLLRMLGEAGINVEQMDNRIFSGGKAASATIQISGVVDDELRSRVARDPQVLGVSVEWRREDT